MNTNPEIFKNNFEALQKRYPDMALMLSTVKIEHYQLVQKGEDLPNVVINREFYYKGNVKEYCEEQYEGLELKNVKVPVFLGFGLGYEVMYWMQQRSQKFGTQAVIVVEKDPELFMCAMNVADLRQIIENPKIFLFVGIPPQNLYIAFRTFYQANIQELLMCGVTQPVFTLQAMKAGKEYYMVALQALYESIYHCIQNFGNSSEDSLIGLENMLDNVKVIAENPGINLLYDKFKGKPAVIVATGPSLKKNMHLLKGLEDKALIISVDASFKFLMENDIKPHMVTSLEREHEVEQFFNGFDLEEVKDIYMTACPVLFNHVYESYTGPQIIVYRDFDHFKWLNIDRGILKIQLSSSNMAFKIAEALGCNPIVLIGQDLAYGENDETHATPVPFSSEGEGVFYVKGNIQDQVKTNSGWYNFLKAYELDVANHKGKVINCTEGGAYIQKTEVATFAETVEKYIGDTFNPLEIIKANLSEFKTVDNDIEKLKMLIEKTESEVSDIVQLCIDAAATCKKYEEELSGEIEPDRLEQIRQEIVSPRLKIQGEYGETFQKFLMHIVQSVHLAHEMETVMVCTNAQEVILKFINWYSFIGDISEICLQSLRKAKDKLYGI
jgi:hypothetical protein